METNALSPRGTALLLALAAGLLLFRLGAVPLLGPDEPRYARVAVEMYRSGDFVTPTLQWHPWLEKPPLYYWLAGAAFSVLGETETAARLPSVAAGLLLVGATALFGARLFGGAAGLHAGFVLATALLPFLYGRAAAMDMLLAACVTATVGLIGLRVLGIAGRLAIPAAYAFAGLATLAKGPLGIVLPALVVGGFMLVRGEWRLLRLLLSPWAILAFLAVAAPWYVLVLLAQGASFVDVFLLDHNLARFTTEVHRHPGPLVYYVPVVLIGLFPWTGPALGALAGLDPRRSRTDLFVLLWLALPFLFFSLAGSKLPGYIVPCLAPLALLVGRWAARTIDGRAASPAWAGPRVVALLGLAAASLFAAVPAWLARVGDPDWRRTLPAAAWAILVAFVFSRRVGSDATAAFRVLRVGGAGLLLLVGTAAPEILARRESGRRLFGAAMGREVMAWGAWRAAWMAGYFYNDGKVREVQTITEVTEPLSSGPVLVLCGPGERRRLESVATVETHVLARGPRENVLLRLDLR
jgi:4-amino-4-deoxy-L-arabinose transferase-like glycosyltransferase